jgi:dolichol-phosphate mannosyltransferase
VSTLALDGVSVVVPVYNEVENVGRFHERIQALLDPLGTPWEIIFCVDPCTDGTEARIEELNALDPRVKMLRFSRRFGQAMATIAGLEASVGAAVVTIDCDMQDPPEMIAEMFENFRNGSDVVYTRRRSRDGETKIKLFVASTAYKLINRIGDVDIPVNAGDFRLISRRVADHIVALEERNGYMRGLVPLIGFPSTTVLYDREARMEGDSKYNKFTGGIAMGFDGVVGFSRYPLHIISLGGIFFAFLAMALALVYAALKLAGVDFPVGNPTIVIIVSLMGGIQLLSLGIMGEYVGRIYDEVRRRPKYIVETRVGLDD